MDTKDDTNVLHVKFILYITKLDLKLKRQRMFRILKAINIGIRILLLKTFRTLSNQKVYTMCSTDAMSTAKKRFPPYTKT